MTAALEIKQVNDVALAAIDNLLADWLPDGKCIGKEYWPTNPVRGDRKPGSFSINRHTGTWHDFASGDKGGDLVSLLAYLRGCRQMEAARLIAQQLGLSIASDRQPPDFLQDKIERQRIAHQRDQRQQQHDAEQQVKWDQAAVRARHDLAMAGPADPAFPYLIAKGIQTHHFGQLGNKLLIPICWRGAVVNLQTITADGTKRFLPGGRITGCYVPFGRIEAGKDLLICEGVATAATLAEEAGSAVAAALSANNLLPVGLELQRRYPDAVLIVGVDDDRQTAGNPGKTAAIHAAAALGCGYVLPAWPEDAPLHLSDFNDLRQWREGRL
ncbi:MAG: toprim domain-containing protein [Pseudomonas sp.]